MINDNVYINYIVIPHISITINRLILLDNGQKSYSTPSEASWVFPLDLSFFNRRPLQFVVDVVFKCLRQRSNELIN